MNGFNGTTILIVCVAVLGVFIILAKKGLINFRIRFPDLNAPIKGREIAWNLDYNKERLLYMAYEQVDHGIEVSPDWVKSIEKQGGLKKPKDPWFIKEHPKVVLIMEYKKHPSHGQPVPEEQMFPGILGFSESRHLIYIEESGFFGKNRSWE